MKQIGLMYYFNVMYCCLDRCKFISSNITRCTLASNKYGFQAAYALTPTLAVINYFVLTSKDRMHSGETNADLSVGDVYVP